MVKFSRRQLQKKFKHADDFGVGGKYNEENAYKYQEKLETHINVDSTLTIVGSYRGRDVVYYIDTETRLSVISDVEGNFHSGWKLNRQQLECILKTGKLGGG